MKQAPSKAVVGRPRTFDADKALDCAMKVFWEKGYEGSSLPELTRAMGMNRPSLYAVFGNKEQLFHKAMARYNAARAQSLEAALAQASARAVVEQLLRHDADALTAPENPHGCLGINGALACSDDAKPIRDDLAGQRQEREACLCRRFERARADGDLPVDTSPAQLARYVMTVSQGMAVQAAAGVSRADLHEVIAVVLRAWPA